jgi:hypothetical protein
MPKWGLNFFFEEFPEFALVEEPTSPEDFYTELLMLFSSVFKDFEGIDADDIVYGNGMNAFYELF